MKIRVRKAILRLTERHSTTCRVCGCSMLIARMEMIQEGVMERWHCCRHIPAEHLIRVYPVDYSKPIKDQRRFGQNRLYHSGGLK